MSEITDWIKYELYPSLFNSIDVAFSEHNFKQSSKGWISNTYLDGSRHHSRKDKTVISRNAPGFILENGGETLSLVDYIMRRDGVAFIEAVKTLAAVVGLQPPKSQDFSRESYQIYQDRAALLEDCNNYFVWCLENATGAKELIKYLSSRGYSIEDIKAMELGYIPSQEKLLTYLREVKKHSDILIGETIKLNNAIGDSHKLSIPYRSGGSIKGFKFRTIGDATPKYLNSSGMDKSGGLFNLLGIKGEKDVIVVEGELDSLHATIKGIPNVVATGGSSISSEQVKDAVKRGAKKFTICFDTEPDKTETTAKYISSAIAILLEEGISRIYIAKLPDLGSGKTDVDRLIKERGIENFKEVIDKAIPYYEYKLLTILHKYGEIEAVDGVLSAKNIDSFLDEIVETASKLEPIHRDQFKKKFVSLEGIKELGITEDTLSITIEQLTSTKEKAAQDKELKKLLSKATEHHDRGETAEALELLKGGVDEVKATIGRGLLPPQMSFNALLAEISTIPPAYKTGYSSLDTFVGFTPGAITLIAGRPSHGKTTLMFNLLLQMSDIYRDERFYFFTYEEPLKNLSIKLLNCLVGESLSVYFSEYKSLAKPTNYEFLKTYIRDHRTDLGEVEEGKKKLRELIDSQRITVIDRNYSVEELYSLIAYLNKREKIGGVFIDYIQRMKTARKTQDKRTEIAHISDEVLQIAKDSGLPIILGAQLNRGALTTNKDRKPTLENLKEAGNLEEDANTVLSVYNESRERAETEDGENYNSMRKIELEIKALKNREGEVNQSTKLIFDKWTGLIKEKEEGSSISSIDIPGVSFANGHTKKQSNKKIKYDTKQKV